MFWTEERVELLRTLLDQEYSAGRIAAHLGVSRNTVIGKIHRLGLGGRGQPSVSVKRQMRALPAQNRRRPRQPLSIGNAALKSEPGMFVASEAQPFDSMMPPIEKRLTIAGLTKRTCKWPIGDPGKDGFYFCGHHSAHALPYCHYHARLAYRSARC